jgi:hypothetical protein
MGWYRNWILQDALTKTGVWRDLEDLQILPERKEQVFRLLLADVEAFDPHFRGLRAASEDRLLKMAEVWLHKHHFGRYFWGGIERLVWLRWIDDDDDDEEVLQLSWDRDDDGGDQGDIAYAVRSILMRVQSCLLLGLSVRRFHSYFLRVRFPSRAGSRLESEFGAEMPSQRRQRLMSVMNQASCQRTSDASVKLRSSRSKAHRIYGSETFELSGRLY